MTQKTTAKKQTKLRDNITAMSIVGISALILLASILAVGCAIWNDYRDEIMNSQKNQLLITSQTLADNMELSLKEFKENLEFLYRQYASGEDTAFFRNYIEGKDSPEINLYLEYGNGSVVSQLNEFELLESLPVTQVSPEVTIWQAKMTLQGRQSTDEQAADDDVTHVLIFKRALPGGGSFCLVVDEDAYYRQLISDIQIGTNGYIMVKSSGGIILMHPEQSQIGIHVINGRKALYPDLDYESLEAMIAEQCSGGDGISEYYSYWWTSSPLVMVKKISAYAEARIGGDFWVISSVIDYDDFCEPIEAGFRKVSVLFAVSLAAAAVLFICVSTLLFDRRRTQTELRSLKELNERLETIHRGEEMMAHQQRLQVIGTMTGGIAHEFNNFLTPIMGYAELLMMELDEDSDAYDSALEIYDASEKAKDVVRQVSAMSRRNVETVFSKVDCGQMLDRACKMVQPVCPANIRTELTNGLAGVAILGNKSQLSQVILNICINAVHAIGSTDGCIAISGKEMPRGQLAQKLESRGIQVPKSWQAYAVITIADDGCGMDAETLRQIFKPFFTTKKTGEGTGLGLALAEQIVTSHRGILFAESEPGRGSAFHICLPVLDSPELLTEMAPAEIQKLRIAAGDDNQKVLSLLEKNFRKLDVKIETGSTRAELLEILQRGETDVLVVDESLEDLSGIDFCMSLQGQFPALIKLIMADYVTNEIVEAMQNHIISGYVQKPVSDTAILEEVRRLR